VGEICRLREANGITDRHCDSEVCVFWRAVDQLGEPTGTGCAVQHYEMLGEEGMAAWLLSVRERVVRSTKNK
jgi:hypothetical protein